MVFLCKIKCALYVISGLQDLMAGTSFPAKRFLTSDLQKNIKEMAKTYESEITSYTSRKNGV